jgi:hypothetical protein
MPAAYVIDAPHHVVLSRAWGILTDEDLERHQKALTADPAFDPSFDQLFDFESVTRTDLTTEGTRYLARRDTFGPHSRRAFVVVSQSMFGMMRMYEQLLKEDPDELRVQLDHLAAAREWLGLPIQDEPPA